MGRGTMGRSMTVGGAERAHAEGAEAAQATRENAGVGPVAAQKEALQEDRVAGERSDAVRSDAAATRHEDEKAVAAKEQDADLGRELSKEEERAASRAWADEMDAHLVRREPEGATQGRDAMPDPVTEAARRDEEAASAAGDATAGEELRRAGERTAEDRQGLDAEATRRAQEEQERTVGEGGRAMLASQEEAARAAAEEAGAAAAAPGARRGHEAGETEAQAAGREQWVQELRDQHQALARLDDAALERVLAESENLASMRGRLVEELLGVELDRRAAEMGDGWQHLRAGSVEWRQGEEISDGLIARQSAEQAGVWEVAVIAEAKAGELSARGLGEAAVAFEDLGREQRRELERFALDELRERLGAAPQDLQRGEWAHADELRRTHGEEIAALMRELHGPDQTGQLRNDFERLIEHARSDDVAANVAAREPVAVLVDGEEARLRVSPQSTRALVAAPDDVDLEHTRERMREQGIEVERVELGLRSDEVRELALDLQRRQQRWEEAARLADEQDA
jgi:hypothetical protein